MSGLFMDGAAWSHQESSVVESAPKKLFSSLPILHVTAVTKANKRTLAASPSYGPFGAYECPVYKYPTRSDRYLIFTVALSTQVQRPLFWVLRGVCLLSQTS